MKHNLFLIKNKYNPNILDEKMIFKHEGFYDEDMWLKDYLTGLDLTVQNTVSHTKSKNTIHLDKEAVEKLYSKLGEWLNK